MKTIVYDIEADNLLPKVSKIHCISAYCTEEDTSKHFGPNEVEEGIKYLMTADMLVGHNQIGYDVPTIQKLYPNSWKYAGEYTDSMLLGCILYPDDRILSLDAWAKKLHLPQQKVAHDDWSRYSPEMKIRCDSDVVINTAVYNHLVSHPEYKLSLEGLDTEQKVLSIHSKQVVTGVSFDTEKAILLYEELRSKASVIRDKIVDMAPKAVSIPGVAKCNQCTAKKEIRSGINPYKKDGKYTIATVNYFPNGEHLTVKGPYTKIEIQSLNPDADGQVKDLLLSLGWRPTEWNFKKGKDKQFIQDANGQRVPTSPKLTEDSYSSLPPGLGTMIAEYNVLCHRQSFLLNKKGDRGALIAVRDRGDGRVSADAFTCGTNTGRYRHSGTVCNIPRPTSPYGNETRSLFRAAPGKWMVGVDLSGIELRCLAWYLLKGGYSKARETADMIISPDKSTDFHTYNAKVWGVDRNTEKSAMYALLYGAGGKRLASTLGKEEKQGNKLKKNFYKAHPGIEELIGDLETAYSHRKYIKNIDGRPLYIRSKIKLLNTLLQGTAAVVFKKWMIALDAICPDNIRQVIAMHDEMEYECDTEEEAIWWGKVCEDMATTIGKEMGSPVIIEAVASVGKDWHEVH